ncbi:hypothetical protein [Nocardioides sp.]|uniref:hypothetical protein n=1 Tax=Nocardioides sp. TaxID=35761 RepID=UPI002736E82F|nr:hypothetical protein [Nocardioides sp.]MDP3894654.1 hypothetical protein [Nocardioides sp.]
MVMREWVLPGPAVSTERRVMRTATRDGARTSRARARAIVPAIWALVLLAAVATAVAAGSDPRHALAFGLTWIVSTTLPGMLLWRALARSSTPAEAVAFGNVLGIAVLLLAWLPAALLGDARLTWWGPLAVLVVFAAIPGLRIHWRSPSPSPDTGVDAVPVRWHVAMAVVSLVALWRLLATELRALPLPGAADTWVHPDMWFQLALVDQLQHSPVVQQAQAAGIPMTYHWFANADIAAVAAMSGTPTPTALLHLWLIAMMLTVVLCAAALARRLLDPPTRGAERHHLWWVGPLAALVSAAVPVVLVLGEPRLRNLGNGFQVVSASGVLSVAVVLAVSGVLVDLVRRDGRGRWVLAALLLALAAGTKPSILPVVVAALLLVSAWLWLVGRRAPTAPLTLALVGTGLAGVGLLLVSGGGDETGIEPFRTLDLDPSMQLALSASGGSGTRAVALGVFALYVLTELPRLLGLLGTAQRPTRRDPAVWFCTGVVLAGFAGSWVLHHIGFSQQYFWRIVLVLATVATLVVAVRVIPHPVRRHRLVLLPILAVVLAGLAVGSWVLLWSPVQPTEADPGTLDRLLPYAVAGVVLVATLGMLRQRALSWLPRVPVLTLLTAFVLAAGVPVAVADLTDPSKRALQGEAPVVTERQEPRLVTVEQQRAALWLRDHAAPGDHVVTNVMCVPTQLRSGCDATAYWVAALSGRPVVLGGWAYTIRDGETVREGSYKRRPSPFPERLRLSREMIEQPSTRTVERLRDLYGARWVFADRGASRVSPDIERHADLVYENGSVLIYRIP